jgi:hypothetical protein
MHFSVNIPDSNGLGGRDDDGSRHAGAEVFGGQFTLSNQRVSQISKPLPLFAILSDPVIGIFLAS